MPESETGYKLGPGMAPLHARFKKEQSGEPQHQELPALLADALNETAVVTIDGRRRRRRRASHGRWLLGRGSLFRSTFPLD